MRQLTHYAPDGTPDDLSDNDRLSRFVYTLRSDGRRSGAVEEFYDGTGTLEFTSTWSWTYDALGRLTQEELNTTDATLSDFTTTYEYDLAGNRLEKATDFGSDSSVDETIEYDYDANDRLLEETSSSGVVTTYGYDFTQQTEKTVKVRSVV